MEVEGKVSKDLYGRGRMDWSNTELTPEHRCWLGQLVVQGSYNTKFQFVYNTIKKYAAKVRANERFHENGGRPIWLTDIESHVES